MTDDSPPIASALEHSRDAARYGHTTPRHTTPIRVALVNDYELVLRGLHAMLRPYGDRVIVVEHELGGSPERRADVALFDTFASRRSALTRAKEILDEGVVDHVVLYTWDAPEQFLAQASTIGVDAVISKRTSAPDLVRCLECVVAGERVGLTTVIRGEPAARHDPELTPREHEVLTLLALGLSNAEIGDQLFLSVDTIKTHVRRVFHKLGVNNRTQAALRALDFVDRLPHSQSSLTGPG